VDASVSPKYWHLLMSFYSTKLKLIAAATTTTTTILASVKTSISQI
jgi:hypothetical protein